MRILCYDSISEDPIRSSVSPGAFSGQMEYLARSRYCLMSLSDAVNRLASGEPVPDRSVVVTLDDGFADNYEQALPILRRSGVPATVFLTVSYIGTDRLPTLTRSDFVPRPLSWEQVKEMHAHGIEFGSHTLTHPMLAGIPLDDVRRELEDSKRRIEDELGVPASLFCYPRGDFNEAVKGIVRDRAIWEPAPRGPGSTTGGQTSLPFGEPTSAGAIHRRNSPGRSTGPTTSSSKGSACGGWPGHPCGGPDEGGRASPTYPVTDRVPARTIALTSQ